MNNTKYILSLFLLMVITGCKKIADPSHLNYASVSCTKPSNISSVSQQPKAITIWIHGTRVFFSKFILPNFFYTRIGLHNALEFDKKYHIREIADILCQYQPSRYDIRDFYFYGWSGKLSFKARYKAAHKLFKLLINIINEYEQKYGHRPKIRIITHSHGGNVALNLAHFNIDLALIIDELILLACPVQNRTCHLSKHEMFKKIYSLYSRFDSFQIIDPQRVYYWLKKDTFGSSYEKPDSFFSRRRFDPHSTIKQVPLKFNNRGIMHIEFITNKFVTALPAILDEIDSWDETTKDFICIKSK